MIENGLENNIFKVANHSATGSDLLIQRLDIEYDNGWQEPSDTSPLALPLADGIDIICDESEANILEYGDVSPSLIHESADLSWATKIRN